MLRIITGKFKVKMCKYLYLEDDAIYQRENMMQTIRIFHFIAFKIHNSKLLSKLTNFRAFSKSNCCSTKYL